MQVDVIGQIVKTPGTYDEQGNELTPPVMQKGFHVNAPAPAPVPGWEGWRMEPQPATPLRVYAGPHVPACYHFPGESTFKIEYEKVFSHALEQDEITEV